MAKVSKRLAALKATVDRNKLYAVDEALTLVRARRHRQNSTNPVDVAVNLGIDPRKSDQVVRGSVVLPRGTGKSVRVAVFAQGANAEAAKAAGAEIVGFGRSGRPDQGGMMDFDVVIATPDAMRIVGQLGQILGPRGLMPNPKVGTVTLNVTEAVKTPRLAQYRTDKSGIMHATIGRASFEVDALRTNLAALVEALVKAKPASSKGVYLKKIAVSSTMGIGVRVDQLSLRAGLMI